MTPAPGTLPTKFPVWCRAVYSFSGESKRDLGFIEGDLIECLNAGDGSWWMGRLRRDKRMMGLFPSNFVQVLDENFRPTSRTSSPLPDRSPSPNPFKNPIAPTKPKTKSMRKPFQAYAAPDMGALRRAEAREKERLAASTSRIPSPAARGGYNNVARGPSPQSQAQVYQSQTRSPAPLSRFPSHVSRAPSPGPSHYASRAPSPAPNRYMPRGPSPAPNHYTSGAHSPAPSHYISRAPSPAVNHYSSRGPSPAPNHYSSRGPSPAPNHYSSRGPSPAPNHSSRGPSPAPNHYSSRGPSPAPNHYTSRSPSPNPHHYGSRAPSPAPSFGYQSYSRGPSPAPQFDRSGTSSPPPPPPPHRSIYAPQAIRDTHNTSPNPYQIPSPTSPCPPSPAGTGRTPSPLRSAMDDVMLSLADMGVARESEIPEEPIDPWSPEAFDQTYISTKRAPRSSTAIGVAEDYNSVGDDRYADNMQPYQPTNTPPPQLSNYVQRMENRLSKMYSSTPRPPEDDVRPAVPPKSSSYAHESRPKSSLSGSVQPAKLRHRKSAYEVGKAMLGRSFTTRTDKTDSTTSSSGTRSTTTNGSSSTQMTDKSLMSGPSASGFSSTSAGSLARKREMLYGRAHSALGSRKDNYLGMNNSQPDFTTGRSQTPMTGISYHSSHASDPSRMQSPPGWSGSPADSNAALGGLMTPKTKKTGFFKRIVESAKTGAASARSSISIGESSRPRAQAHSSFPAGVSTMGAGGFGNTPNTNPTNETGSGGVTMGVDWVQVRRDINRSNSLSRIERVERKERCQMMDYPAISPVEELLEGCDGDEGVDGNPVAEPTNFQAVNLTLVDKNTRFINSLPPMSNAMSLATGYVCRPYRSDIQRLRAIFIWVSEKITWEEGFDNDTSDSRRVIQTKHGSSEEVAFLVMDMCKAVGIHAEVIRGYLKSPGEVPDMGPMPRPNHFWNAVVIDGEWRMMDCSLASPSHPRRSQYTSASSLYAEPWWFLARPIEMCWTHIPEQHVDQHLCPPVAHEVLLALPCACPAFFINEIEMVEYDTSLIRIEDLELVHIKLSVPPDVECVAEVEARAFERDADGDLFETGEIVTKRALAQAEWVGSQKRYTIKALLPGDEGAGILKIYAGKRGLMHSIKDIPHALAVALPIIHTGDNPPYEFLTRHPTPHAQRHDLYVAQPQCQRLAINNTFVFAVRQHPSSLSLGSPDPGRTSPIPFIRPGSAMSLTNSTASGSGTGKKPAKLAIQAPGGKILRLMRKEERNGGVSTNLEGGDGGTWETIIKCGERGVWRGLVLADRSARWCVFAEWTCV
ncbi:e8d90b43-028d-40f6-92a9-a0bcc51462b6 [Sclerotinia trifoliorum]|uniref:E8d90b43-028d-40f6-92a9-a0bcc51462b6 n=1 Tax=Sclerotinia trifoliorum TaxID=28548 RepID=A0A8H2W051_9HELO|nr:e8d90b43-028d-40f6-92a9-a0bcc51462b6 [Sclerotinia trifoliorum]